MATTRVPNGDVREQDDGVTDVRTIERPEADPCHELDESQGADIFDSPRPVKSSGPGGRTQTLSAGRQRLPTISQGSMHHSVKDGWVSPDEKHDHGRVHVPRDKGPLQPGQGKSGRPAASPGTLPLLQSR